jgi:tetratricopeptide (TPR) repeat protein
MNTEQSKGARAVELQECAWDLQASGNFDAAFLAAEEAVRLLEECEGPDTPDVANLLNDLADIERDRQNFQNAPALAKRARDIEDALGDTFTGETAARMRGRTLELLGTIRCTLGENARAEVDLKVAPELAIGQFGEDSAETIEARNNLGMLYKYWGRFEEGLVLYERALRTAASIHGEESLACGPLFFDSIRSASSILRPLHLAQK